MTTRNPIDILLIGATHYEGHQLTDQRIARALSAAGQGIVYVDPARNVLVKARGQSQGSHHDKPLVDVADGLQVATPMILPMGRRPALAAFSNIAIAIQLRLLLGRRITANTVVLAFAAHPTLLWALRRQRRVLVVKDDALAGAGLAGVRPRTIRRRRRAQFNRCEAVITVSSALRAALLREGVSARVIPPGADIVPAATDPPPALPSIAQARAVFSGMISDRIDLRLLFGVADTGCQLILVGGHQPTFRATDEFDTLVARDNVHLLGWRESSEVSAIMQACDIGLLPYTLSQFNLASSPLKTMEYLAAGLAVLSTALPAVIGLDCPQITIARSAEEFAEHARRALQTRRSDEDRARSAKFARSNSWAARAEDYLAVIRA